jgi:L-ascorbate metabolism protein UlaG (beta-lactamase superfamily)
VRPLTLVLVAICLLLVCAPSSAVATQPGGETGGTGVKIEWFGQACFLITAASGARIVIDPFDPEVLPYSLPEGPVTVAFASHDHLDHNYLDGIDCRLAVKGGRGEAMLLDPPKTIPGYGTYTFGEDSTAFTLRVIPSFHDGEEGKARGHNTISVWDIDGLRIVHMGDLGSALDTRQAECLGSPDVLLLPVGGHYTIDSEQAREIVNQLSARIVVPMHFKTVALGDRLPIAGVEKFMKGWDKITISKTSVLSVSPGALPKGPEVVLLKYSGQAN